MLSPKSRTIYILLLTVAISIAGFNHASAASGSVLNFDGGDYLRLVDAAVLDQGNRLTLSIWAKPDAAGDRYIIYRASAYYLKLTSSCAIEGAIYYSSAWRTITSSAIPCNGSAWTHIEMTYDKDAGGTDELKLYINTVLSAVGDHFTAISDTTTDLYIGAQDSTPTLPFDGKIDDFKLYQYARTADEVKADYNNGLAAHLGKDSQRDDGLVGYWNMEEGKGQTVYDRSGNGNNGTLGVSTAVAKDDPVFTGGYSSAGAGGTALKFDGKNDYVDAGNGTSLNITDAITLEAWVMQKGTGTGLFPMIVGKDLLSSIYPWTLRADTSGSFVFASYNNAVLFSIGASIPVNNTWYHVVGTFDKSLPSGNAKIYLNGVLKQTANYNLSLPTNAGTVKIGRYATSYFNGSIDEVRIYNRALSADEIRQHYNQKKPVLEMKFDEGSGTTTKDESFNNNDGTLYSGATVCSNPPTAGCPTWTTGKFGSALKFDGTDDYVDAGTNSVLYNNSNGTIGAWVKSTSDTAQSIFSVADLHANYFFSVVIGNGATGYLTNELVTIMVTDAGGDTRISYVTSNRNELFDGKWHYVSVSYNGSNYSIYIDSINKAVSTGVDIATVKWTNFTGADNSYIGKWVYNSGVSSDFFFNGFIDDVKIYNYARTPAEILVDYNAGKAAHLGKDSQRDDGLVGYWNMEEGKGQTVFDRSGNGNNGTFGASTAVAKDDPVFTSGYSSAGAGGTGLKFDGKDDYVNLGKNIVSGAVTYSWWQYVNSIAAQTIFSNLDYSKITSGIRISITNTTIRFEYWSTNTKALDYTVTKTLNDGWHHIAITWDGKNTANGSSIFINGILITSATSTLNDSGLRNNNDRIGREEYSSTGANYYKGLLDEVRIYNRALSADEIRQHYNQKKPILEWKFDEGSGTSTKDESFNNNDGTLYSGATVCSNPPTAGCPTWAQGKFGSAINLDGIDDYVQATVSQGTTTVSLWVQNNSVWEHVVKIGNTYYINGIAGATPASYPVYISGSAVQIGKSATSTYVKCLIDDFRIYSYPRAQAEILTDYNNGLAAHLR